MLLTQRTNVLFNEKDYRMLKELSKKNNQTIGELIRHAIAKTFGPKKKSKEQLLYQEKEAYKFQSNLRLNYPLLHEVAMMLYFADRYDILSCDPARHVYECQQSCPAENRKCFHDKILYQFLLLQTKRHRGELTPTEKTELNIHYSY